MAVAIPFISGLRPDSFHYCNLFFCCYNALLSNLKYTSQCYVFTYINCIFIMQEILTNPY